MAQNLSTTIVKPRNDKREYKSLLLSNSLQVLLISDPDTDKAAASMGVSIGAFSDPEGLEGLAHFLEHMLFYASEKYPLEDSYMQYLTEHGGRSNAFTSSEHTNFHFDVNAGFFEEALDRFAQFFISPLMSQDATAREINAVDSENKKNLLVDAWRWNQLQKHLSSSDHPFHKFSTGNKDTLDAKPTAKGIDIREELIKFYETHYSSNLMHLVIYGKETIEELEKLVQVKFSGIKNTQQNRPYFAGQPCHSEHLQILVKTVPVKECHTLAILWPITPEIQNYKEAPSRFLGHLIGHEADGSLFCLLKSLGWATSLSAGETESSFEYAFFGIMIELTDAGQEHMEEIVKYTFQYLNILRKKGVAEWIFNEVQAICETKFHYQDKIPPISYVTHIASNMELYPIEDWLVASSLPSKFDPITIQMVLDQLLPNSSRIIWASKQFEGSTNETEPWYGTAFTLEKIKDELVKQWENSEPDPRLGLPSPNMFIPTDLSLKQEEEKVRHPILLLKSRFSRLWYKPDTMFFTPKAFVKLDFNCPESNSSPEAEILTDIFTKLLVDYLNEYAYYAEVAGLAYSIDHTGTGFQVTVSGYNHKMRILLEKIFEKIVQFEVKQERFAVIKEMVLKKYLNYKFHQPYQQAFYYCSILLEHHMWQRTEFLEIIPQIEADDLVKFASHIISRTFLECYVAGNMTSKESESLIEHIEDSLFNGHMSPCKPLFPSQHLERRIVKLDSGTNFYYPVEGLNEQDENSALHHYIQLEQDNLKMNVELELFVLSAKQPAFYQLRSVEQLGYIVVLMTRNDCGIRGVQFIIQSTVKDPAQLDIRVEAFLKIFESKLHAMSDDEFKSNVNALIDSKLEKHKNLREESRFYWREIDDGTLKFDRKEVEVTFLRKLTKEDLLEFFNTYIKLGAPKRRKLSLQVYGSSHSAEYKIAKQAEKSFNEYVLFNGKEVAQDTVDSEALKDENVEVVPSDQPADLNKELKGYQSKQIDDIYNMPIEDLRTQPLHHEDFRSQPVPFEDFISQPSLNSAPMENFQNQPLARPSLTEDLRSMPPPNPLPVGGFQPQPFKMEEFQSRSPPKEDFRSHPPVGERFQPRVLPGQDFPPRPLSMEDFRSRPLPVEDIRSRPLHLENFRTRPFPGEEFRSRPLPGEDFRSRPLLGEEFRPRALPVEEFRTRTLPGEDFRSRIMPGEDFRSRTFQGEDFRSRTLPGEDFRSRPHSLDGLKSWALPTENLQSHPFPTGSFQSQTLMREDANRESFQSHLLPRQDFRSPPLVREDLRLHTTHQDGLRGEPVFRRDFSGQPLFRNDSRVPSGFREEHLPHLRDDSHAHALPRGHLQVPGNGFSSDTLLKDGLHFQHLPREDLRIRGDDLQSRDNLLSNPYTRDELRFPPVHRDFPSNQQHDLLRQPLSSTHSVMPGSSLLQRNTLQENLPLSSNLHLTSNFDNQRPGYFGGYPPSNNYSSFTLNRNSDSQTGFISNPIMRESESNTSSFTAGTTGFTHHAAIHSESILEPFNLPHIAGSGQGSYITRPVTLPSLSPHNIPRSGLEPLPRPLGALVMGGEWHSYPYSHLGASSVPGSLTLHQSDRDFSAPGDQYDPLHDSIEPSSLGANESLKKLFDSDIDKDNDAKAVEQSRIAPVLDKVSSRNAGKTRIGGASHVLDVEENNKHKDGATSAFKEIEVDNVAEAAMDTEVGAVENGSPLLEEEVKNWSPGHPLELATGGAGEIEIDQGHVTTKSKKSKDSRSMKLFRSALAEFVKDMLKPSWREGNMSKEAFKTIVKKAVDKVAGAMQNHQIPKTRVKIDQYVASCEGKLSKLVQGYMNKYVRA